MVVSSGKTTIPEPLATLLITVPPVGLRYHLKKFPADTADIVDEPPQVTGEGLAVILVIVVGLQVP